MIENGRFTEHNFIQLCDHLAEQDSDIKSIIEQYGYPPCWSRKPNFETLIHIILEQQVSLASARAAFDRLKSYIGELTPEKILALSDEELRSCYFSRQKSAYAKNLSLAIRENKLSIDALLIMNNESIREQLTTIKGIGNWTVDVFLMMALHSSDLFPMGDIALVNSLKHIKNLPSHIDRETLIRITDSWKPYRTIASFILWHAYICRKGIAFTST